ncbi:Multiple C2 and transmembrane domain-containing protein 2 [Durusdinium trenchii]|uniref:Multiple C2 and transmembrane domain-containing protein 2 n=1 Tax=Durusdinium trenchii TaxID=1381693 RepID=A0ABP0RPP5_9DINO
MGREAGEAAGTARWAVGAHACRATHAVAWPLPLPLLHPRDLAAVVRKLETKSRKSVINTYEDVVTGEEVVEGLAAELGGEISDYDGTVLELLEECELLLPVTAVDKFRHRRKRLYRVPKPLLEGKGVTPAGGTKVSTPFHVGVIYVHASGADGLLAESMTGTSDAFATIVIGDAKSYTRVVKRELNPDWKETWAFVVRFQEGGATSRSEAPRGNGLETTALSSGNLKGKAGEDAPELCLSLRVYASMKKGMSRSNIGNTVHRPVRNLFASHKTVKSYLDVPEVTLMLHRDARKKKRGMLLEFRGGLTEHLDKVAKQEEQIARANALQEVSGVSLSSDNEEGHSDSDEAEEEALFAAGMERAAAKMSPGHEHHVADDRLHSMGSADRESSVGEELQSSLDRANATEASAAARDQGADDGGNAKIGRVMARCVWMDCVFARVDASDETLSRDNATAAVPPQRAGTEHPREDARVAGDREGQRDPGMISRFKGALGRSGSGHNVTKAAKTREEEDQGGAAPDTNAKAPGGIPKLKRQDSRFAKMGRSLMRRNSSMRMSALEAQEVSSGGGDHGMSRSVQYAEMRKQAKSVLPLRRAAIEDALLRFAENRFVPKYPVAEYKAGPSKATTFETRIEEDGDAAASPVSPLEPGSSTRCFVIKHPRDAFDLLGGTESEEIDRAMWVNLAPLLAPLCHFINAHEVFDALLMCQFGSKLTRAVIMSGQVLCVRYPVFYSYVRMLHSDRISLDKAWRKSIEEFPDLKCRNADEVPVRIVDKVRGGRQEAAFMRGKSQYGGKLVITTTSIYFLKRHIFHSNDFVREDLLDGVQVLESNGAVDYGLMVGFKNSKPPPSPVRPSSRVLDSSASLSSVASDVASTAELKSPTDVKRNKRKSPKAMLLRAFRTQGESVGDKDLSIEGRQLEDEGDFEDAGSVTSHDGGPEIVGNMSEADKLLQTLVSEQAHLEEDDFDDIVDWFAEPGEEDEDRDESKVGGTQLGRGRDDGHGLDDRASASGVIGAGDDVGGDDNDDAELEDFESLPKPTAEVLRFLGMFAINFKSPTVGRYAVYRFPSYGSWRKRDVDILILRNVIAYRIFCDHVLDELIKSSIESISGTVSLKQFREQARSCALHALLMDITCLKALVKLSEKKEQQWLSGVDTFEAFGDKWSWKRWSPLGFMNLVCSAVQPRTERNAAIRRKANVALWALAVDTVADTEGVLNVKVKWSAPARAADVQKRKSLQGRLRDIGASMPCQFPGAGGMNSSSSMGSHGSSSGNPLALAAAAAKARASFGTTSATDVEEQDRDDILLVSLDEWWLEHSETMQTDIVRGATKLKSLGQNFELFKSIMEPFGQLALETKEICRSVIEWDAPMFTIGLGVTSLVLIFSGYTGYFAGLFTAFVGAHILQLRTVRKRQGFRKLYVPKKQKKTLLQKYRQMKDKYVLAKRNLQKLNLVLLRARAVLTWENERVTSKLVIFVFALSVVLAVAPRWCYELAVWMYVFTKKFRSGRFSRMIKQFLRNEWSQVPPTPLWEKLEKL